MIKTISMKNVASYRDPVVFEDCKKINFIYGTNGSGKSTISRFLNNIDNDLYKTCEIKNDDYRKIYVYNKDFREANLKEVIPGVFTIGKDDANDIERIKELKNQISEIEKYINHNNSSVASVSSSLSDQEKNFKNLVWDKIYKENEEDFNRIFTGYRSNKDKMKDKVLEVFNTLDNKSVKDKKELQSINLKIQENRPEKIPYVDIEYTTYKEKMLNALDSNIWGTPIIGNNDLPISKLINTLDNSSWVKNGINYIEKSDVCPFCQQHTLTDELKKQLNDFFGGEYESNMQILNDEYNIVSEMLSSLTNTLNTIADYITTNESIFNQMVSNSLKCIVDNLSVEKITMMQELNKKLENPSLKLVVKHDFINIFNDLDKLMSNIKEIVKSHNVMVDTYEEFVSKTIEDTWACIVNEQEMAIQSFLKTKKSINKRIDELRKECKKLELEKNEVQKEMVNIESRTTTVQPTVDKINKLLNSYGFTNFKITSSKTEKNCYQISRLDGSLAKNLSEGEETFISFLYFMQLVEGAFDAKDVSQKRIVVIDDPICSLDGGVLYIVSSIVKDLLYKVRNNMCDVEQVFIMTHNVFFHKEASYIDGRTTICNDYDYWILYKNNGITQCKSYGNVNPIKSSYELLWQEYKNSDNLSLVNVQNIMRRIIENYFKLLGEKSEKDFEEKFESTEEKLICKSLISWINDGSHSIYDDIYIDSYTDATYKYKEVFRLIFEKMGHISHYNMMMGIEE